MPQPTASALSVSEVNRRARLMLEQGIGEVWVEGELSGVSRPASGHLYFTLKDTSAQLRCALFRNRARFIAAPMRDGDRVRVRGRISLFEPRGDYQLIAEAVQSAGQGDLLVALERLKQRLAAEGLFANSRPLPYPPRHLLVLTSPSGAAIRDVLAVLGARWPLARVTLIGVPVQGREAAPALIAALGLLNRQQALDARHDVVLITRGGGSLEDLWAFNDEHLARAIFHSRLPVISAVGHEIDVTLSDLVADVRAPTPSAAAEMLMPDRHNLERRLAGIERRLLHCTQTRLKRESQRLDHLRARLRHPGEGLDRQRHRLGELELRLRRAIRTRLTTEQQLLAHRQQRLSACHPRRELERAEKQLAGTRIRLEQAMPRELARQRQYLAGLARQLQAVSPLAVLGRGYAILEDDAGQVVQRARDVEPGQALTARLGEGHLDLKVIRTKTCDTTPQGESGAE